MGLHWSLWLVSASLVAPPQSCPGVVGGIALATVLSPGGGSGSSDDAACLLCSSRVSSWHLHCWGNLSLGHWHWLCPAPVVEPLGCFHCSMSEGFGLP